MNTKIDYQHLDEWRWLNRIKWCDMAKAGGVSPATISQHITKGRPLSGEILVRWREHYGWTDAELCYLCLNGEAPEDRITKQYIAIGIDELEELLIGRNIERRRA